MTEYIPDKAHTDTHTNNELFHAALTNADEDVAWMSISELQRRGSRSVFEHACKLCTSLEANERRVGVDILGQLGITNHTFHEEMLVILLAMLEQEQEPKVLKSIAVALGHRHDSRAIEPLVYLKQHPDDEVRDGVAFGLLGYEDELAIQTLIELSGDPDSKVRDWATFGLGSQIESDTLAIREALMARLTDEEGNVRGEALIGLARRHDLRMIEPLHDDLKIGWLGSASTDDAVATRQSLYPVLVQIRDAWEGDRGNIRYRQLEETIEKCR